MIFENAARVYPDYKQNCTRLGSLSYKHPSNNYCCHPHMSGNFLELLLLFFLINAGIPLCHYADAEPFHLNSQDSNRYPENAEPVSTLWCLL